MELVFKKAVEKKNEIPQKPTLEELSKKDSQMSIFDIMNQY